MDVPITHVELRYFSAAAQEIYELRAALAHEALLRRRDLALKTFPASRRGDAEQAVERMLAAARGDVSAAYATINSQQALVAAGADPCLTNFGYMSTVDRREAAAERP